MYLTNSTTKPRHKGAGYVPLQQAEKELKKALKNPKLDKVEIEHTPGEVRSEGTYDVFEYDKFNVVLDKHTFRYSHRSDKRAAMNRSLAQADKIAIPNSIKARRVNF
jgi:hypothetical protein